jgi:hypothetical protein
LRIEQTRRRLARLRAEGLVDRNTLPQADGALQDRVRSDRRTAEGRPRVAPEVEETVVRPDAVENRITALRAGAGQPALSGFVYDVRVFAASLADLLHHGPSAPVWRPVHDPEQRVHWTGPAYRQT